MPLTKYLTSSGTDAGRGDHPGGPAVAGAARSGRERRRASTGSICGVPKTTRLGRQPAIQHLQRPDVRDGSPAGRDPARPAEERAAFGPAYEAAGRRARLGRALGEVYEDGPGWVQQFDGGSSGRRR